MPPERRESDFLIQVCNVKHEGLELRIVALEEAMIRVMNRPPVWATILIAVLCTLSGVLAGRR